MANPMRNLDVFFNSFWDLSFKCNYFLTVHETLSVKFVINLFTIRKSQMFPTKKICFSAETCRNVF
jgi:hypothetical protein